MTDAEVVSTLERVRVLPVMSVPDAAGAEAACRALLAGGISCVEITFRTDAAADAIRRVSGIEGMLVGAGTVLSAGQAEAAAAAGARFAVAPGTSEPVVEACRALGLPFFPGIATPSEIERARALGCHTLKVFPAGTVGGVAFLRAVSAPYRDVRFVPTGGIDASNLAAYLGVPSVLACGGSWLCDQALIRDGRFDEIERLAREAVEIAA
ncbi:MAG TPA: bifunctional 4-hydroxy-2-oxoglutarate aldolase/2-dehydro-3-deoxy-phosphogluconate aldolase [Gaiellaceae bacterium]|nr:bifunctional 4-hydroxy-2-oxoglutarate aldolase/2-dehydro-3-deoxy-phosphogluconate aldolase [Gaiellaceae bacterium]